MKKKPVCIGVDLMGAEIEPASIVHAITRLPREIFATTYFVLFAAPDLITQFPELASLPISFHPCKEVITMDEEPLAAVRRKKESTTVLGIDALKEGSIDAFLSCANTGALVTASVLKLKTLPGIERPALATFIPTSQGSCLILDVGAFPQAGADALLQFAYLGAAFTGIRQPRVGLLNIGAEFGKGTKEHQAAQKALSKKAAPFTFVGNVEPQDVFRGKVDVVVTSGFAGNIFLKTAEAVANALLERIESSFSKKQKPDDYFPFTALRHTFSQDDGQGAYLLGVEGYVCKCHGSATPSSIQKTLISLRALIDSHRQGVHPSER